jgi:hypothetical protein
VFLKKGDAWTGRLQIDFLNPSFNNLQFKNPMAEPFTAFSVETVAPSPSSLPEKASGTVDIVYFLLPIFRDPIDSLFEAEFKQAVRLCN